MRLTLRTLLAYLDDTLSPSEIKEIGEKVAESESAQELIARIKQVTRRRRLTVPPATGPGSFEVNDVAEYLDNTLAGDQLGEIEKQCLESDVHLAEIAACHQILTLVLGEPPAVPPKARERMYALVKGRESIPYRKAVAARKPSDEALADEEQLGLSGGWLRWVLPAAAVLLIAALALAVWSILPEREGNRQARNHSARDGEKGKGDDRGKGDDKGKGPEADRGKEKDRAAPVDPPKDRDKEKKDKNGEPDREKDKDKGAAKDKGKTPGLGEGAPVDRRPAPAEGRVALASFTGGYEDGPAALVSRKPGEAGPDSWVMTARGGQLYSNDTLVSLPGCASIIETKSGLRALLRGGLPEQAVSVPQLYLLDSAVVLHPSKEVDLDLTLLRGRVYLSNRKAEGPAKVRLRFGEREVWDLTLAETGNEVAVDLWRTYRPDMTSDEEPFAELRLALLRGETTVNVNSYDEFTETAKSPRAVLFGWESARKFTGMQRLDELPAEWRKTPPSGEALPPTHRDVIKRLNAALKGLEVRLAPKDKQVDVAVKEGLAEKDEWARVLAIYCLAAIDDADKLIDAVGDEDLTHGLDRFKANFALQQWLARGLAQGKALYDEKNNTGILLNKFKRANEAKIFYDLLYAFPPTTWNDPKTFEALAANVRSPRVAIAELAYHHLAALARGAKLPAFNAAAPQEDRKKFAEVILEMIDKKQLPPRAPQPPAPKDKDKGKETDREKDKDKDKGVK